MPSSTSKIPRRHTASLSLPSSISSLSSSSAFACLPCESGSQSGSSTNPSALGDFSVAAKHGHHRRTLSKLPRLINTSSAAETYFQTSEKSTKVTNITSPSPFHVAKTGTSIANIASSSISESTARPRAQARAERLRRCEDVHALLLALRQQQEEEAHADTPVHFTTSSELAALHTSMAEQHDVTKTCYLRPLHLCELDTDTRTSQHQTKAAMARPRLVRPKTFLITNHACTTHV